MILRLIVTLCLFSFCWFLGYEWGMYSGLTEARKQCKAPNVWRPASLPVTKAERGAWVRYLMGRTS